MFENKTLPDLKEALIRDPQRFDAEEYDLEYKMIPDLEESLRDKSVEGKFTAWSEFVDLLPHFKKLISNKYDDSVWEMANCIAISVLRQFQKIAPNDNMPVERLSQMLSDMRKIAFFVTSERDKDAFAEVLKTIHKRAPELAKIPENGHCVWFSGWSNKGNIRKPIPLDGLIHMAKYSHLHPNAMISLWTDDINSVENSRHSLMNLLRGRMSHHVDNDLKHVQDTLSKLNITPLEAAEGLGKIRVEQWQNIFLNKWNDFPEAKKELLRSTVINDTSSAAPLRLPGSAKDIIFMAALATMGGGVAFDLDVIFKQRMNIFDPFGVQCMAEELPPGGPLAFSSKPAVRATASNSQIAMKALEKMADFLRENGEKKRVGEMDRPDYLGRYANSRYRLTMQFAEQLSHAVRDELGNNCYSRFDALNQLSKLDGTAFFIPQPLHRDVQPERSILRRASDPSRMQR